ncbi:hypothetical protein BgiMline_019243, partial [Biomphalaria glabrata]
RHKSTSGSHLGENFLLTICCRSFFFIQHVGQLCYIRHSPRVNSFLLFDFCWALMENKVLDICQV